MKTKITDKHVRDMQPPAKGMRMDYDTDMRGFAVRITPTGTRVFVLCYAANGIERRLVLGRYPAMTVLLARRRAMEVRRQVDLGDDPFLAKQVAAREMTMAGLADRYITEHVPKKRSGKIDVRRIHKYVLPAWKHRKARDITRADVDHIVSPIAARGAPYEANHVLALVRKMFSFAMDKGIIEHHPCLRMKAPAAPKARTRAMTTAKELRILWEATGRQGEWERITTQSDAACIRFLLLTGCRASEATDMTWSEVDLEERLWTLPAERSKNKRAHLVPLTDSAIDLLAKQKKLGGDYVFHSPRKPHLKADRIADKVERICRKAHSLGLERFTPHDLRRSVETGMAAARVPKEYRDRVLNHADHSVGGVHYNLYDYRDEKRAALEAWERRLESLIKGEPSTVVPMRRVS